MDPLTAPSALRDQLITALGPSYATGFQGVTVAHAKPFGDWVIEELTFESTSEERIPANFLRPPDGAAAVPAVIYAHAHGNNYEIGKAELLDGRPGLPGPYAPDLMNLGIAALCIELPCFGARQDPDENTRAKALLWEGDTLFGQMLGELRAGIDFLSAHPAIKPDRIGAVGFSMGSTLAWWLAALDARVQAASAQCSFADLKRLTTSGAHNGHGLYMMVPGLLQIAGSGQIAGLAAPRALQICAAAKDWSTPQDAFDRGVADLRAAFAAAGASENLSVLWDTASGHMETPDMRASVLSFLDKWLNR